MDYRLTTGSFLFAGRQNLKPCCPNTCRQLWNEIVHSVQSIRPCLKKQASLRALLGGERSKGGGLWLLFCCGMAAGEAAGHVTPS